MNVRLFILLNRRAHHIMKLKENQGLTLIECLISILLLAIVLAGGMSFYFNSTAVMTLVMHKKTAMEMVTQAMEQIKNDGYLGLPLSGVVDTSMVTFGDFSVQKQRQVTDESGPVPKNKKVEIQVRWFESGNPTARTIGLVTYMAP